MRVSLKVMANTTGFYGLGTGPGASIEQLMVEARNNATETKKPPSLQTEIQDAIVAYDTANKTITEVNETRIRAYGLGASLSSVSGATIANILPPVAVDGLSGVLPYAMDKLLETKTSQVGFSETTYLVVPPIDCRILKLEFEISVSAISGAGVHSPAIRRNVMSLFKRISMVLETKAGKKYTIAVDDPGFMSTSLATFLPPPDKRGMRRDMGDLPLTTPMNFTAHRKRPLNRIAAATIPETYYMTLDGYLPLVQGFNPSHLKEMLFKFETNTVSNSVSWFADSDNAVPEMTINSLIGRIYYSNIARQADAKILQNVGAGATTTRLYAFFSNAIQKSRFNSSGSGTTKYQLSVDVNVPRVRLLTVVAYKNTVPDRAKHLPWSRIPIKRISEFFSGDQVFPPEDEEYGERHHRRDLVSFGAIEDGPEMSIAYINYANSPPFDKSVKSTSNAALKTSIASYYSIEFFEDPGENFTVTATYTFLNTVRVIFNSSGIMYAQVELDKTGLSTVGFSS